MKRFLKLMWWAAVVAAIVWMLRDRLVPAPETAAETPPHFRVAPPPPPDPTHHDQVDDLESLKGIGPVYAARLADHGINSFAALAAADAADLAERIDVRQEQVADWIEQAQGLAG